MVTIENHIGKITVSENYLTELIKHTVTGCFGVAGVCESNSLINFLSDISGGAVCQKYRGIQIHYNEKNGLVIDIHIKVTFGANIPVSVKSIAHKVNFTVQEALGINVDHVNVYIDDMNN